MPGIAIQGDVTIKEQKSGLHRVRQKGYLNGRVVRVDVLDIEVNPKKLRKLMRTALHQANDLVQHIGKVDSTISKIHQNKNGSTEQYAMDNLYSTPIASLKGLRHHQFIEFTLTFKDQISLKPPLDAKTIRKPVKKFAKRKAIFKHFVKKIINCFLNSSPFHTSDKRHARVALAAPYLATEESFSHVPVKLVQKVIDSQKICLKLRATIPSSFLEAHKTYSKQKGDQYPFFPFTNPTLRHIASLSICFIPRFLEKKMSAILIEKKLKKLAKNDCAIFSMQTPVRQNDIPHFMLGSLSKQTDGNFTFGLTNAGKGIHYHPEIKSLFGNLYQQTYVVRDIRLDDLKIFLRDYWLNNSREADEKIKSAYQNLLKLGKPIKVLNNKYYNKEYYNYSEASCIENAILRAALTKKSFAQLQIHLKIHNVFKMYRNLALGIDKSYGNINGILELTSLLLIEVVDQEMLNSLLAIKEMAEKHMDKRKALQLPKYLDQRIFEDYKSRDAESDDPKDLWKRACFLVANFQYANAADLIKKLKPLDEFMEAQEQEVAETFLQLYQRDVKLGLNSELIKLYYDSFQLINNKLLSRPGALIEIENFYQKASLHHLSPFKN